MSEPRASIVISSYNYERFLRQAIESALDQTWQRTEVIVVDDGSTDRSREIITGYQGRVAGVLKNNGGMASTQNAGFAASRGDIVLFLDADDLLLPTALERAVEKFAEPGVVRVQWPVWEVDATGRKSGRRIPERALLEGNLRERVLREGPDACVGPPTSGNAWSRTFLEQVLPIPESLFRQHSDTYLMTLAPLYGIIRAVAEPQTLYRVHGGNDFAGKPVDEQDRRNLEMFDLRCELLAERLVHMGLEPAPHAWKRSPGYQWMHRRHAATEALKELVPQGACYILVDDQQWSEPCSQGQVVSGRRTIPFLERDGRYWGQPADDETAVCELQRLRRAGATAIAFAWPAFWWIDHYAGFHRHLRERFVCLIHDENLLVFDLRSKP